MRAVKAKASARASRSVSTSVSTSKVSAKSNASVKALTSQLADASLSWLADVLIRVEKRGIEPSDIPPLVRGLQWLREQQAEREGPPQIKARELAAWLSVSTQAVSRLCREPDFPKPIDGFYDVAAVLKWLHETCGELRKLQRRFDSLSALTDEHKTIKMQKDAVDLAERKRGLVDREAVEMIWVRQVHRVRRELEQLPGRLAGKLQLNTPQTEVIADELRRICERFASAESDNSGPFRIPSGPEDTCYIGHNLHVTTVHGETARRILELVNNADGDDDNDATIKGGGRQRKTNTIRER